MLDRHRYPPSNPPGSLDAHATRDLTLLTRHYATTINGPSAQNDSDQFKREFCHVMLHCHQESGSIIPRLRCASKNCLGDSHDQCACRKRVQHPKCNQNWWPKSIQRGACYKSNDAEQSWKKCDRFWCWCRQWSFFFFFFCHENAQKIGR